MSQTALGEKIGVSFRQVQKYENGINRVGVSRLEEIAQALNVPMAHFLSQSADTTPPSEADTAAFLSLPEAPELAQAMLRISDSAVRRQIVDLARSIAALCDKPAEGESELV